MAHEIMENDNMFSVGSVPWHGIGNVLDNPPTIIEGLEKANLNWTVSTLPLFCQTPAAPIQSETRTRNAGSFQPVNHQAVMRNDTMEILGVVGQNWTPLQNIDAFGIFAPLVEDKSILLETAGSLKNGRRVWILARINADSAEIGKGDEIRPYVLLSNAHDGTMAVNPPSSLGSSMILMFIVTPPRIRSQSSSIPGHSITFLPASLLVAGLAPARYARSASALPARRC